MAAVFDGAGVTAESAAVAPLRSASVTALRPGRRGPPAAAVAAALAAGLTGLGAGALVFQPQADPAPARAPIATPTRTAPALVAPGTVLPVPAGAAGVAAPADAPQPAAAQPAPVPAASVPPAAVARLDATPPARASAAREPARSAAPRRARARSAPPAARQVSCSGSPAGEACRDAVIRADRRLRTAYARAAREGVPNAVLVDYRERWADLREREADRPRRLIVEYRALASALQQEPREEEERYRSHSGSPLRGLRTALLSWW